VSYSRAPKDTEDAVRLYEQGWSIRQVADKFDTSYGATRRVLSRHTTLRIRGGRHPRPGPGTTSG
jgi:transposase